MTIPFDAGPLGDPPAALLAVTGGRGDVTQSLLDRVDITIGDDGSVAVRRWRCIRVLDVDHARVDLAVGSVPAHDLAPTARVRVVDPSGGDEATLAGRWLG